MSEVLFDPFDPEQAQNAWPLLKELRARGAAARIGDGMYYVTRYDACREILKDNGKVFSYNLGFRAPGVVVPPEDRLLGEMDAPQHTFVRRAVVSSFNTVAVRREEPFIHRSARAFLEQILPGSTVDLVSSFTRPLPNTVTVHMLGFPVEDAEQIATWSKEVMESEYPAMNRTARGEGFAGAFPEYWQYIDEQMSRCRRRIEEAGDVPGKAPDDVVSRLLVAEVDGQRLSERQVHAVVENLLLGGFTTTSQLLGNLLYTLLTDTPLEGRVRADPSLVPGLVEESLRVSPPVLFIPVGCMRDTTVGETRVAVGERVILGTASANRDETVFEEADTVDVERANADKHLTFGFGPHLCIGAELARTTARIALEELFGTFPEGALTLDPSYSFENVSTYFECGPARLPVAVAPSPRQEGAL